MKLLSRLSIDKVAPVDDTSHHFQSVLSNLDYGALHVRPPAQDLGTNVNGETLSVLEAWILQENEVATAMELQKDKKKRKHVR